jgi:hypothetical protein
MARRLCEIFESIIRRSNAPRGCCLAPLRKRDAEHVRTSDSKWGRTAPLDQTLAVKRVPAIQTPAGTRWQAALAAFAVAVWYHYHWAVATNVEGVSRT